MANTFFEKRIYVTLSITLAVWGLLIWDYFHGGVPSHHLLAREDLPSISNWWGGILLPALSWFLTFRIQKRLTTEMKSQPSDVPQSVWIPFLAALLFGMLVAGFFAFSVPNLSGLMMLSIFVLALFFPVYRSEYILGFILGMIYTFGGVLPILISTVLAILTTLIHRLIRPAILFVLGKLRFG